MKVNIRVFNRDTKEVTLVKTNMIKWLYDTLIDFPEDHEAWDQVTKDLRDCNRIQKNEVVIDVEKA